MLRRRFLGAPSFGRFERVAGTADVAPLLDIFDNTGGPSVDLETALMQREDDTFETLLTHDLVDIRVGAVPEMRRDSARADSVQLVFVPPEHDPVLLWFQPVDASIYQN